MVDDKFLREAREARILLAVIARISGQSLERRLSNCPLPISGLQFGVMKTLSWEEHTLSDLSRMLVLDPSTLVPVVDALERKGLISRRRDPEDRRRAPLALTDEGSKLLASINHQLIDEDDMLLQGVRSLGEERTRSLLDHLRALMKTLPNGETILERIETRVQRSDVETAQPDVTPERHETRRRRGYPRSRRRPGESIDRTDTEV